MGYYTDLFRAGNTSGLHAFDAAIFAQVAGDGVVAQKVEDKGGEGEMLRLVKDGEEIASDVILHFNGDRKDAAINTVLIPINQMARLPEDVQTKLYHYEQTPGETGRREGSTVPPRDGGKVTVKRG